VDSDNKLVHSAVVTAANVHDSPVLADLLHGEETRVWGDSAYTGQGEVLAEHAPQAQDLRHQLMMSDALREMFRGSLNKIR